jgi:hypothetical protein
MSDLENIKKELSSSVKVDWKPKIRRLERAFLWSALIIVVLLSAYLMHRAREQINALALDVESIAGVNEELKSRAAWLESELKRVEAVRLQADRLDIRRISLSNLAGDLIVRGEVMNRGRKPVHDIGLTVYLLNDGHPIYETTHIASSHDGEPLRRGQYRRFKIKINDAPESAKEAVVLITDVEIEAE